MAIHVTSVEEYNDLVSHAVAPMHVSSTARDFAADISVVELAPDVQLNHIVAEGPSRGDRTAHQTRRSDGDGKYSLVMYYSAGGSLRQEDREATFEAGDAILVDLTKPYVIDYPTGIELVTLRVNRTALLSGANTLLPTCVPMSGALTRLLARVGRDIVTGSAPENEATKVSLTHVVLDLAESLIRSELSKTEVNPHGRAALLLKLRDDVRARLHHPDLGPADLARRHHLSLRYVHTLFAELDMSPAAYIREQRLTAAKNALRDQRRSNLPIAAIAHQVGFIDISTFNRAFRRRFEMTPSDWRQATILAA